MEDRSEGAANNGSTQWGQTQDSNDRGTNQRWGSNGGRGAITRRHNDDREGVTPEDTPRQRESLPGIRPWNASEPIEMAGEPESRTERGETGEAWQNSDELEQEEQERGQIMTIGSPDEEVNQGDKDSDPESEERGGTF